jgi:Tol biopolymer transport system component/DNA-binding winged helix-turn-helix (wHTH) protein
MSLTLRHLYTFDSYIVDVNERVLFRDGRMVPLTPKVFETLLLLVKNQGSIVTKEKMLNTLWPDVFVEESNVTFNITMLRKALGDTKQSPTHIETVPRRGYRFKTKVREVLGEDVSFETTPPEAATHAGNGKLEPAPVTDGPRSPAFDLLQPSTLSRTGATISQRQPSASLFTGRRLILLSVVVLLMTVTVVATIWRLNHKSSFHEKTGPRASVRMPLTPTNLKIEQITGYGNIGSAAVSPDGKQIAYVEANNGQESLWLRQTATAVNVRIVSPVYCVYNKIGFSHDGNYIYFARHVEDESSDLYRIPAIGGLPTKVHENVEANFSLSPDDSQVAFKRRDRAAREDTLYIADLSSGRERPLIKHHAPDWLFAFSWSPDGEAIIFASGETESGRQTMSISEVNVETAEAKLLIKPNWYYIQQFEWLPDGSGLLICAKEKLSTEIWQMSYPELHLQKLTDDVNNYLSINLTSDAGAMIAVQSTLRSQLWVSPNFDVSKAVNIAGGRGQLAWMPDGRLVYDYGSQTNSDLWIANADGTAPKQLIINSGLSGSPAISPDGRTIVFQSDRTGTQHLWRMNSDGGNQVQLTNGYAERNATISPDGKWVYYNSAADHSLWKIQLDGGQALKLTDDYSAYPSLSPDGKLIASFRFPHYGHEATIVVRRADDLSSVTELQLAHGFWISRTIQWEPDSAAVIYAIEDKGKVKLYSQPLNHQPPHQLLTLNAEDEFEFAISPRRQLAFISTKWEHNIVSITGLK